MSAGGNRANHRGRRSGVGEEVDGRAMRLRARMNERGPRSNVGEVDGRATRLKIRTNKRGSRSNVGEVDGRATRLKARMVVSDEIDGGGMGPRVRRRRRCGGRNRREGGVVEDGVGRWLRGNRAKIWGDRRWRVKSAFE